MKIIHIYDGHETVTGEDGSVPKVVWNLAKEAADSGNQVTVIERKWKGLPKRETVSGVDFRRIRLSTGSDIPWDEIPYELLQSIPGATQLVLDRLNFALAALRLLRDLEYDVIHVHLPFAANVMVSLVPSLRSSMVYTAHLGEVEKRIEGMTFSPDVYLANRVSRMAVLNEDMKQTFERNGVNPDKIVVAPNGVDIKRFHTDKDVKGQPVEVLFVGTITPRKGVQELLESIAALPKTIRDQINLSLVGKTDLEKDYYESLQNFVDHKRIGDTVTFLGFVSEDELISLYKNADIFTLPSFEEGFGMVITEAMAARTAVIGSNTGGIPTQIRDGIDGLLVRPGDVGQLTEALENLVASEERRNHFASKAVERSEEFSWDSVYQLYDEMYRDTMSKQK